MASDGQRSTSTGDAEQPASPDATGHFTRPDSKHATSSSAIQPVDANRVFGDDTAMPKGKNSPAAKDAALTVKGKFNYFFTRSFLRPTPYATAIAAGAFGEWLDDDHHHHAKPGDFAADSMTRAARSFAFGTSANFFEKFAYASLFKQDAAVTSQRRRAPERGLPMQSVGCSSPRAIKGGNSSMRLLSRVG